MVTRSLVRAVMLGGFVSAAAAACAQGNQLTGVGGAAGGTSAGGSTSSGAAGGVPEAGNGQIGSPCKSNADCDVGSCSPIGNGSYCTQPCPPDCPSGSYCTVVNGISLCAPDLDQQCIKCSSSTDCKIPSDQCLTAPLGDKFCARDCSVDGVCPNGFTCVDKAAYTGDGGVPDAGSGDAGDAGKPTTDAFKWCVPNGGASCPCNQKRDDVARACSVKNQYGDCNGMETCDGKKGQWEGCTAATPAAETCNGKDDNCNGMTDDGDQNALCASAGPKPPHANWACKNATCSLGACDSGWTSYPAGPASAGCGCQVESGEPNGSCGTATNAGSVSDTGGPITIQGTLSSGADVDFWTFDAVDVDEGTTNSYHVRITFTAPATNNEFLMDVMRGGVCTDTPSGEAAGIVAYDWCVNGFNGVDTGEAPCGPAAASHCGGLPGSNVSGTHTSKYYLRVFRKPGATGTCTQYSITVSAAAGTCDFAQKCASP